MASPKVPNDWLESWETLVPAREPVMKMPLFLASTMTLPPEASVALLPFPAAVLPSPI